MAELVERAADPAAAGAALEARRLVKRLASIIVTDAAACQLPAIHHFYDQVRAECA